MLGTGYTFYMSFFISFNPYNKHYDRHNCDAYFTKDKNALEMKKQNPSPPQHLKEVKRGEDKKNQKKMGQMAQNQIVEISINILELNSKVKRQ